MEFENFKALLTDNFTKNHLENYVTDENIEKFYVLTRLMLEKNSVMNITAIKDVERIIPLHYADCLMIAPYLPAKGRVIDVGCGGGFPTLPLAIVRPDVTIVGVDSTDKKVRYVAETVRTLGLDHVSTISARAEDLIKTPNMRESFDVAVSRAVARLNILDELCLPFVKIDGQFITMKGAAGQEELNEARNGIEKLGGSASTVIETDLLLNDSESEKRTVILIDKVNFTPTQYPRQFGQIKKKPL